MAKPRERIREMTVSEQGDFIDNSTARDLIDEAASLRVLIAEQVMDFVQKYGVSVEFSGSCSPEYTHDIGRSGRTGNFVKTSNPEVDIKVIP